MPHSQPATKCLLPSLVQSANSSILNMAPFTKVFLLYLATSLFLCSFTVLGQTNELLEEDPNVMLRSQSRESVPNELAHSGSTEQMEALKKLFARRLMHFFNNIPSEKFKRDDDVPPGFIGVRGRRSRELPNAREFEDILRNILSGGHSNLISVSPEMLPQLLMGAQPQIKKSDSNVYKSGFHGVRG